MLFSILHLDKISLNLENIFFLVIYETSKTSIWLDIFDINNYICIYNNKRYVHSRIKDQAIVQIGF